ncbi:MAG: GNAT family N-acetyltransferase [Gammaproteobacteria bacterium]|nr:MAG: GNAT family N-acetyltransferase [Gammaproteobacteria bacterium]
MKSSSLTLRQASVSDLHEINRIIEAAIMTWPLPDRVKRLSLPSYKYSELDLKYLTIMVAETTEGEMAGVAAWQLADSKDLPKNKTALLLHGIYVDPSMHRQGIGTRLFKAAEDAADELQLNGLLVKAKVGSEEFYKVHGMKKLTVENEGREFVNRYWKEFGK